MKILIGTTALFDDAQDGWALSGTSTSVARGVEEVAQVRASEIVVRDRGNDRTELQFEVSRPHADEAAAIEFLYLHEADIPRVGTIKIIARQANRGERTLYLLGKLRSVSGRHIGHRTFHTYSLVGGRLTKVKPTVTP